MPALVIYRLAMAVGALLAGLAGIAAIADPQGIGASLGLAAAHLVTSGGVALLAIAFGGFFLAHKAYR